MQLVPDEAQLLDLVKEFNRAETENATLLNRAIFTLSSAALALSLTFSRELPLATAVDTWLLYTSWFLFVITLTVNIAGHLVALRSFRQQWKLALKVFRQHTESEAPLAGLLEKHRDLLYWFNVSQAVTFLAAMYCLAGYVTLNSAREMHMTQ